MLLKLISRLRVVTSSNIKNFISTSSFCQQQKINFNFMEEMDKAIEEQSAMIAEKKFEQWNNRKKKRTARQEIRRKREWHEPESEESKKARLESGEERIKRKKYVVLLGYSGVKYSGMQRNPGASTIEEELLKAMVKQKWITDESYEQPQVALFQRAARTDKGVSACRQTISLKIPESVDIEAINKDLPEDIRVFATKRVTKGFNSKDNCDARTYSYTLPTYALAKKDEVYDEKSYRLPPERLEELNKVLNLYTGTRNFHNFTIRKEPNDPSCKRYIMKFQCPTPFVPDNTEVEFARLKITGQSFMMHQIRRMVGLTIAVMRGYCEPFAIAHAMEKEKFSVPQAPGLGLVLEKTHYDRYNKKFGSDGHHEVLEFEEVEPQVEEFFREKIMSTIINTELKERPMAGWVKGLRHHSFTDIEAPEKDSDTKGPEEDSGNLSD